MPAGFSSPGVSLKRPMSIDGRVVEVSIPQLEAGAADIAELLGHDVGLPVAVGVAKTDDAAGATAPSEPDAGPRRRMT